MFSEASVSGMSYPLEPSQLKAEGADGRKDVGRAEIGIGEMMLQILETSTTVSLPT